MNDKRPVGELSIEELERVLAIRRREERRQRIQRFQADGRTMNVPSPLDTNQAERLSPPNHKPKLVQHERSSSVPAPMEPSTYDLTEEMPRFEDDTVDDDKNKLVPTGIEPTAIQQESEPKFVESIHPKPQTIELRDKPELISLRKRALGWALTGLEVFFVGALAIVLYRGFTGLETIQDNTNRTQAELNEAIDRNRVLPSPTPILSTASANYILPGGHTPPDEDGFSIPNLQELEAHVPENVLPAVLREVSIPPPTQRQELPNDPVAIDIPALGIHNATIVSGDNWVALKAGIGHRPDSGRPGTDKNVVLTGHNDIYGEIFRYLPDLQLDDEIRIRDVSGRVHTYRVSEKNVVEPTDVWVLDPNLGARVTLITCYPYKVDNKRYIVFAELVE